MTPKVVHRRIAVLVTKYVWKWFIKDEAGQIHYALPFKSKKEAERKLKRMSGGAEC
jgi:hypothetical protein